MGFGDILRNTGLPLIDRLTGGAGGFQDAVTYTPWIGSDSYGAPLYGTSASISAIVDERLVLRRSSTGEEILQHASVTIPRPLTANGASGRREPVDPRDKFVLPSGYTGPILDVVGVVDPNTHYPFMVTVSLG